MSNACQAAYTQRQLRSGTWVKAADLRGTARPIARAWPAAARARMVTASYRTSSRYGTATSKAECLLPCVEGETAAVTVARVHLAALRAGADAGVLLAEELR
jgi:hypothetical protein